VSTFRHDPDAQLDYRFDWSDWLAEGETISTRQVVVDGTATVDPVTDDGSTVTAWVSDAEGPVRLTCRITTNQGRTDDRSIRLIVSDR
jgi:hypothetical protein